MYVENELDVRSAVSVEYRHVTDRHTTQTDRHRFIASIAAKSANFRTKRHRENDDVATSPRSLAQEN